MSTGPMGEEVWLKHHPVGLKVEAASAEIHAELVCPLETPSYLPGNMIMTQRHNFIVGVRKCIFIVQEAQAKFSENCETQGHTMKSTQIVPKWMWEWGSSVHRPPLPEWWDNLPPPVQKTTKQQHHLCCWGYSHHSGTGLSPAHEPSLAHHSSLLCLQAIN